MPDQLIQDFVTSHKLPKSFKEVALKWFIPLAQRISHHQFSASKPYFIGINGSQGSGKSTLTSFLTEYLSKTKQLNVANLSLDDFYLTHQQRTHLAQTTHSLLQSRGVPGTHDLNLLQKTLNNIENQQLPVSLPRFDKANDNPFPKEQWPEIAKQIDVVIFEGWCWGVTAQTNTELQVPCNRLELQQDKQGIWRNYVNEKLQHDYLPLYEKMDAWIMLKAPSFSCIYKWRLEQEHKLKAAVEQNKTSAAKIMSDEDVAVFIQHFQRLTEHSLTKLPASCDLVFHLDEQRQIQQASGPLQTLYQETL